MGQGIHEFMQRTQSKVKKQKTKRRQYFHKGLHILKPSVSFLLALKLRRYSRIFCVRVTDQIDFKSAIQHMRNMFKVVSISTGTVSSVKGLVANTGNQIDPRIVTVTQKRYFNFSGLLESHIFCVFIIDLEHFVVLDMYLFSFSKGCQLLWSAQRVHCQWK